jgi:hypothetical protein
LIFGNSKAPVLSGAFSFDPDSNSRHSVTNQAERFSRAFAGPKLAFIINVAGPYLSAYASEMAWRENNRRISNGEQYLMATDAALQHPVSRQRKVATVDS